MKKANRDLLVTLRQEFMSPRDLELEVNKLHELLYHVERPCNVVLAYEVIDMIQYRIARAPEKVRRYMREREMKPFIFYLNRN